MNHLTIYSNKKRIKLCVRCKKEFRDGEMVVETYGNGRNFLRHRRCFTDPKGKPLL